MSEFMLGFDFISRGLLVICGGTAALALVLLAVLAFVFILATVFDRATNRIARRWKRRGYKPGSRLGKILLASAERRDGKV